MKNISNRNVIDIVSNNNYLDDFIRKADNPKYKKIFHQENLFNSSSIPFGLADEEIMNNEKKNYKIITFWDENYPARLKEIYDPPAVIYVSGSLKDLKKSISVVGTRACSVYGKLATEQFVTEFVNSGVAVVSGMAYGIDSAAHTTAIEKGGYTIAVVAFGLDKIAPSNMKKQSQKIIDSGGAVLTAYSSQTVAQRGYFLSRNRIISGLTSATLIVESSAKGGSLWTAKFALDQNKEVYAVPGRVFDEKSQGTNKLIKDNIAQIALNPEIILTDLGYKSEISNNNIPTNKFNETETLIINSLSKNPTHIDEISELTQLDMSVLLVNLLNLEFNGNIRQLTGKYFIIN